MKKLFATLVLCLMTLPASADEVMGEYLAWLGPEDIYNSSGVRLTSFGSILAQDRANFHRFGIRHDLDTTDRFFGDRATRSRLPGLYDAGRRVEAYIINDVLSGRGHYVYIQVIGRNGRITRVDVYEGAG